MNDYSRAGVLVSLFLTIISEAHGNPTSPGLFSGLDCKYENKAEYRNSSLQNVICQCGRDLGLNQPTSIAEHYRSWCSSYNELADCIEQRADNSSAYLNFVFDAEVMKRNGKYVCEYLNDIKDADCLLETGADCHRNFSLSIENVPNQASACKSTTVFKTCYLKALKGKSCNIKTKVAGFQFLDVYVSNTCTRHQSVIEECDSLSKALYSGKSPEECMRKYGLTRDCMSRRLQHSLYPKDQLVAREIDLDRYIRYKELVCKTESDIDNYCFRNNYVPNKNCLISFKREHNKHITMTGNNQPPNITEICRKYTAYIQCTEDAMRSCEETRDHLVTRICSEMPGNCSCPIELPPLAQAVTSHGSVATAMSWNLLLHGLLVYLGVIVIICTGS